MTNEIEQRAAIVEEAKRWIGTPYCSNGCVRGAGVDCGMFPVAVYKACGWIPTDFDPRPYPPQWHMHRDEEKYMNFVRQVGGTEITGAVEPSGPGDFILFKVGRVFAHGVIVVDWPLIIHSRAPTGVDIEDIRRDSVGKHALMLLERRFFTLWPRDDRT